MIDRSPELIALDVSCNDTHIFVVVAVAAAAAAVVVTIQRIFRCD